MVEDEALRNLPALSAHTGKRDGPNLQRGRANALPGRTECALAICLCLYTFQFEYDWSQPVSAAVDGNSSFFEPWKVTAER